MDTTVDEERRAHGREHERGRGREASRPREMGKKGWRDVLLRVKNEISEDNLSVVAAGVAFYALLAVFPALAALVGIYGLVANPADVEALMANLQGVVPAAAYDILSGQLHDLASGSQAALGAGVILGILVSLWSANKGMKSLISALNIAYEQRETRGFFKLNGISLLLTLGAILFAVISIGMVVATPIVLGAVGLGGVAETLISLLRWPVLLVVVVVGLSVVYRVAPDRRDPQWRWVTPGSVLATILWLVGSIGLSIYVSRFGNYNETYGSLGAVIILLLWFYFTAFVTLLGAELNSELEHQTRKDSTDGEPRPMGERGATVADTLGPVP